MKEECLQLVVLCICISVYSVQVYKFPLFCNDHELSFLLPSYIHGTSGACDPSYSIFMISDEVSK